MSLSGAIAGIANYYLRHSWLNFFDGNTIIVDKVQFQDDLDDAVTPLPIVLVQCHDIDDAQFDACSRTFHTTICHGIK